MHRREIAALAAIAVTFHASAEACVPLRYEMSGVTAASFAQEMVEEARSVEVMRVVSRAAEPPDQPYNIYATAYGQVYRYRFETVRVLNGRRGRTLELHGLDEAWLRQQLPGAWTYRREPLWWLSERGYEALQETRIPDPLDSGSIVCAAPITFIVGAEYVVFRDRSGSLLAPGFHSPSRPSWRPQRPVVERLRDLNDPWLREVEAAIAQHPKPGATFWELVFELIFGMPGERKV